ncbi:hypothetical protein MAM1_0035c02621 [Mucor ambiguus]|uniref:Retrotransposon gag domain-containing protein n=1 Tax=Mucor ambiguus TaxID=91626 RepID=A0A0C9LST8_9FUNG|nr:hypothetical protein MAM1_0035c02621 [Mucor ambiguus]
MATLMSSGGSSGGVFPAAGPQAVLSSEVNLANFVPPDLPLFQWPGSMLDEKREPFPSIEGCICRFEDILNSHRMVLDVHWLRLLPRCLGHDLRDWLNEFVKAAGTGVLWTALKVAIIARYGTPKEQLRFGRIRGFLACTKSDEEPIDSFLERFKSLKSKSGVTDKHVVAMVFFDAFPEAASRLMMISMGQADESCFYDLDFVSAVARRVDLAKRDRVDYNASSGGSARKRPSDIPVSAEAKKSKYAAMPLSSPAAGYEKKGPWVSKFGKTMKEHVAERTCNDCNGYFGKGHSCNGAICTPPSSSARGGSNKVLRVMTKKPSRCDVDAMVSTAFACEEADRVLRARKNAPKSGRGDKLVVTIRWNLLRVW